ncbi:SCO4983 family protein [Streptomyces goshikiensis]|uniref:SCO4983 family protein n=1 Tax=Streptomyces goshikiensis TaxID=1942 RepID=UPI00364E52B3
MYEPIRTKSVVHRVGTGNGDHPDYPHSSRGEALDIQLAGHLAALLAVTDELGLVESAERIAGQVARLRGGQPARLPQAPTGDTVTLHQRAHDLAARALLVAASRADTTAAILAAERMDAHAAALDSVGMAGAH